MMEHPLCLTILLAEFGMGFTRYRSLIWFSLIMLGIAIGLALSPVFKLFGGKK